MSRSRILQLIALIVLFVIAVVLFSGGGSGEPTVDNTGYIPPSP